MKGTISKKILLIEDHPVTRHSLTTLLGHYNFEILQARDGPDALDLMKRELPDLIITDILLPTMDAQELVLALQQHDQLARIPVIFYSSAYHENEARSLAQACGVRDVLLKTSDPKTILSSVTKSLGVKTPLSAPPAPFLATDRGLLTDVFQDMLRETRTTAIRLAAVTELSLELAAQSSAESLIETFTRGARDILACRGACTGIFHEQSNDVQHFFIDGIKASSNPGNPLPWNGPLKNVLTERKPLRISRADPFLALDFSIHRHYANSFLAVPLLNNEKVTGWLSFVDKIGNTQFSHEDERLAVTLALQFSVRLENAQMQEKVQNHRLRLEKEMNDRRVAQESLKKLSSAVHQSGDSVVITDKEGKIEYVNPTFEHLTGYSSQDAVGKTPSILKSGLYDQKFYQGLWKTILSGKVFRFRFTNRKKSGELFVEEQTITPIRDDQGNISHFVSTAKDITDRMRSEQALRESEERFRLAFEEGPIGMAMTDTDYKFISVNRAFAEMLGYSAQEFIDRTVAEFVHPNDLEEAREMGQKFFNQEISTYHKQMRFVRKSGEELWTHVTAKRILSNDGKVLMGFGMIENIHQKKQAEEGLALQLAVSRELAEATPRNETLQRILRLIGESLHWDAAEMWFVYKERGAIRRENIWQANARNDGVSLEFQMQTGIPGQIIQSGMPVWIEDLQDSSVYEWRDDPKISELHTAAGFPIHCQNEIACVFLFFTARIFKKEDAVMNLFSSLAAQIGQFLDRKRSEEVEQELRDQLFQSQKMEAIGKLAGGVAHDFNNILMAINSYSELVTQQLPEDHPLRRFVLQISKTADKGANLTRQLLAFSRRQIISPRDINLNQIITNIEDMLRRLIGQQITLLFTLDPQLSTIKADPVQIEQILMNLIVNARDAMPTGGQIRIETQNVSFHSEYPVTAAIIPQGKYASLSVRDTGTGIPEEVLSHVFEPFFTTKEIGQGTGLGLSTVHGIVKQNGGYIHVSSKINQGTTFEFYFPFSESSVQDEPVPELTTPELTGRGETILLVDDSEAIRTAMASFLRLKNYNVLEAANGRIALGLAEQKGGIQLLITDIVMPEMNGIELSQQLKKSRPDMKVIYISGHSGDAVNNYGILDGQSDFLSKPVSLNLLLAKIRQNL